MKQAKENASYVRLPFFGIPRLLPYLRPYAKAFFWMICFGLVGSLTDILLPLFQQYAINHFIGEQTLDTLAIFITLYVLCLLAQGIANFVATFLASRNELCTLRDLRQSSFDHLQTLSFSYFNQNSVGYVHARIMSDTARISELISWSLMDGVWQLSYLIGAVITMLSLNAGLALWVLAVVPVVTVLIALFQKKLVRVNRQVREINSRITGNFNEGLTGAKTIKTLAVEDEMLRHFTAETQQMRRESVRATRVRAMFTSIVSMASFLALALVLWRGGIITQEGVLLIGTLSVFMSYAQGMMEPIRWVVDAVSSLINAQVNIERFTHLMETASDVCDSPEVIARYGDTFHPKKENWEPLRGDIAFRDVTFHYPDGEETVLSHFNLGIPAGSSVAIVGETGAGKSTLVNLVCRFFEPTEGQVLIDGRDARERSQLWLHSHIGYVLQTPHLFSGSIRDNLRYGNPEASDEEIRTALRLVNAEGIVDRMEKGLDSDVGEDGDLLSVGEKQLLSFARAILSDPQILVLDEATASVDTVTEKHIQEAIRTIIQGRTSLMIAHRLSTVRDADVILVVQDGKIVEQGQHADLLQAKGYYYRLYTRQFEEDATATVLG